MNWTKKQEEAINQKGEILVAAAAGSGKTAVLVERNIRKIIKDKIDINKILAITFTTAAASEMKERILNSLYKELEKNENDDIKRQIRLLPKANISTIHSFCFNLIKDNFFSLNLSADVSIGQEEEIELILQEALDNVLDKEYELNDKNFLNLLSIYPSYRNDDSLRKEIIRMYKFLETIPFYQDWIEESLNRLSEDINDYAQSFYGSIILKEVKNIIDSNILILKQEEQKLTIDSVLIPFKETISDDISSLEKSLLINDWDELYEYINSISLSRWPTVRGLNSEIKDSAKTKRDAMKESLKEIKETYLREKTDTILEDNLMTVSNIEKICELAIKLELKYSELKDKKNLLDFADLEKLTLKLLVEKKDDKYIKTDIAKDISKRYVEIQVDEYQDINKMQDLIIWAISNNNVFRVGDLKQSIYKFRNANPDIFIEKYNTFVENDKIFGDNLNEENIKNDKAEELLGSKILLFNNFRSRKNVINFCNDLFSKIMSVSLGDIDYNKNEYLNFSANYDEKDITTDIVLVSKDYKKNIVEENDLDNLDGNTNNQDDINEIQNENNIEIEIDNKGEDEDDNQELLEDLENIQVESYYIANKIQELINSEFLINDSGVNRKIEYKDIVILLRSSKNKADIIEKVLYEKGIPVYADSSKNFLESMEIEIIISLLNIINNPLSDINFVAILKSFFGGFTFNEIADIRTYNKKSSIYNAFKEYLGITKNEKAVKFQKFLNELKEREKHLGITNLLNYILIETGYINYISLENNGEIKKANLKLFIERAEEYEKMGNSGLSRFIQYLENLKTNNTDIASANIIGEKENVVRIMTIHSSKGLEFPVVFLSNTDKKINMVDLNENTLLNFKYGMGINYFDYKKKIKYPTIIKEAIKIKLKEEIIAEEMRVLYVALTRAKEKIIITATKKKAYDYLEKINNFAETHTLASKKEIKNYISPYILKQNNSYLDWILLSNYSGLYSSNFKLIDAKDLDYDEKEEERKVLKVNLEEIEKKSIEFIKNKITNLEFLYNPTIRGFTKVAASRMMLSEEKIIAENIKNLQINKPKFLKGDSISSAEKGSLNHYFLEKLNFDKNYTKDELKKVLSNLIKLGQLTKEEGKFINLDSVINFINTDEYKIILKSKKVKEKQFISKFTINEIKEIIYNIDDIKKEKENNKENENEIEIKNKINTNENILVQGIIDLYYITPNNELKILDYKTDNVDEDELVKRYRIQMITYKKALEKALNTRVDKVLIYSTTLNKYIEIKN